MAQRPSTTYGFKRTVNVLGDQIRRAGESRGFAVSRVLTHWAEIVGTDLAAIARPVDVSYGRGGFGATLTVLTTGPQAPMLEMQKEKLREKVNAVYGYNAIARVRITQTAPTGFSEGQARFAPQPPRPEPKPDARAEADVRASVEPVQDADLRAALERLGRNVLSKPKR
ncbi:DUF721 domain-containing protein [Albibacillus kandeliae]|uniref:DUF721 domain-containing protein n=1 Tax=Albibacillus kandeliae TaxID=2174228 RepID=UPI000D69AF7D|nr:DciA family protein [Albibacillus kandeliae]